MFQIPILYLELQMIPRMHHLVRQCILQMAPVPELIRTQHDAMVYMEPATLLRRAHPTMHIARVQVAAELAYFVA